MDENDLQIFVSHSHEDNAFCLRLVADLRSHLGDDAVWFDNSGGLHGGEAWWDKIVGEITARSCFLVVLSPNSWNSRWVSQEMGIAYRQQVELGKRLLPVRLADSPRRADWAGIQEINFQAPRSYAEALAELMTILDISEDTTAPAIVKPPSSRTTTIQHRLAEEAHTAYGRERWSDVMDKTDVLITSQVMTPSLWAERASAALALNNGTQALASADEALKPNPHDIPLLRMRARALSLKRNYREAAATLTLAQTIAPLDDLDLRLPVLKELCKALRKDDQFEELLRRLNDMQALVEALSSDYDLSARLSLVEWQVKTLERDELLDYLESEELERGILRRIDFALALVPSDVAWHARKVDLLKKIGKNDEAVSAAQMAVTSCSVSDTADLATYSRLAFLAKNIDAKRMVMIEAKARNLDSALQDKLRSEYLFAGIRRSLQIPLPNADDVKQLVFSPAGDLLASVTLEIASQKAASDDLTMLTANRKTYWVRIWATDSGNQLTAFDTNVPAYPRGTAGSGSETRQISDIVLEWLQNGKLLAITQNWAPNPTVVNGATQTASYNDPGWKSRTILINAHTSQIEWASSWVDGYRDAGWASISPDGTYLAWINHPQAIAAEKATPLAPSNPPSDNWDYQRSTWTQADETPSTLSVYDLRTGRKAVSISNNYLLSLSYQQGSASTQITKVQELVGILQQAQDAYYGGGMVPNTVGLTFCPPVSWSPDGRALAIGASFHDVGGIHRFAGANPEEFGRGLRDEFGVLLIINAQTAQLMLISEVRWDPSVVWSPDGSALAITEFARTTYLMSTYDGTKTERLPDSVWPCQWSPHGQRLLGISWGQLHFWNAAHSNQAARSSNSTAEQPYISWKAFANQVQPYAATWYGSDDTVITASASGALRVWDVV